MPSLRALHVIPSVSPRDGGPARAIDIIERALSEAGVEVTTLTTDHDVEHPGGPGTPTVLAHGARRIYVRKWLHPYKVAPGLIPLVMQEVRRHDVVHIHALFSFASTVAAWAAQRRQVPFIVRPLGTLSNYGLRARRHRLKQLSMALVEKPLLRHAAAVHFTSQAELHEAQVLGLPMRSVVIPLGVAAKRAPPVAPLAHSAFAGRRVILTLSRLDPIKNLEALIDAIASSPMLQTSCALVVGGTGEPGYVAGLRARAAATGLADRTVWLGHVEGAQKWAAFAAADVFVLPSLTESFGIAAVEALLAGVPCVLGEGVGVAREVQLAGAGLAVPPEPPAIAKALEAVLGNEALRFSMGARGARFARCEYSSGTMAQRLRTLYEEVRDHGAHGTSAAAGAPRLGWP